MPLVHSLTINALLLNLSRTNECHETRLPSESSDGPASWNAERVSSESLGPRQRTFLLELLFAWQSFTVMAAPFENDFASVKAIHGREVSSAARFDHLHTNYAYGIRLRGKQA